MANMLSGSHAPTTEETPSSLMNLPPELRNKIYHHYFDGTETIQWLLSSVRAPRSPRSPKYLAKVKTSITALRPSLHLLHVCAKVRSEAGPIFYNQYLADTEFVFNIDYANAAENFIRMQAICTSISVFAGKSEVILKFGIQIFAHAAHTSLLFRLAHAMHQYAAWWLQRIATRKHGLVWPTIDAYEIAKLDKLDLSAEESAFIKYDLRKMPNLELLDPEDRFGSVIPGFEMEYAHNRFRFFGPLATIDWEYFNLESVPRHLPSTGGCDEFVHEDNTEGLIDSDDEPAELDFYTMMELDSNDEDERDKSCYESAGDFENDDADDGAACEDDYYCYESYDIDGIDNDNGDAAADSDGELSGTCDHDRRYAGSPKWRMQCSEW